MKSQHVKEQANKCLILWQQKARKCKTDFSLIRPYTNIQTMHICYFKYLQVLSTFPSIPIMDEPNNQYTNSFLFLYMALDQLAYFRVFLLWCYVIGKSITSKYFPYIICMKLKFFQLFVIYILRVFLILFSAIKELGIN